MTTLEQIELVEAWAWIDVNGPPPDYDYYRLHESAEYLLRKWLRWKYPHISPKWYARALWGAKVYLDQDEPDLVQKTRLEAQSKFRSKIPFENPGVDLEFVDNAVRNLPPLEGDFARARIQTLMLANILVDDDWGVAQWLYRQGLIPQPADLMDFLPGMTQRQISNRLKEQA